MTIRYECLDGCGIVYEGPEMDVSGASAHATFELNKHSDKTGHTNFAYQSEKSIVEIRSGMVGISVRGTTRRETSQPSLLT